MADKVFIGGLCPKFIICSDWSVNGKGIVNCGNGRGWDVWSQWGWCVWVAWIVCGVFCLG